MNGSQRSLKISGTFKGKREGGQMRIVKLDEASMKNILADMLKRDPNNYDAYTETVQEIVDR